MRGYVILLVPRFHSLTNLEHNITPSHLELLSNILRRCDTKAQKLLARNLMLSASNLGQSSATFSLIESALRTGALQEYQPPLYRLGLLAKNHDPHAMALLGKVLIAQSKDKEALTWLRKATRPPTGNLEFDGAGEALVNEGRLLQKQNDMNGAEEVFRRAALELDEPSGYFYLSQLQTPGSPQREEYLLKAASSGIIEACHNLGALELAKEEKKQEVKPGSKIDYRMAVEWFTLAAHDGFGLSMLNLATIYKSMGDEGKGTFWLEAAENIPDVFEQAQAVRSSW